MYSKHNSALRPNVMVKHSIKVHDGVVSHIWRASTGQYFILAVTLFDDWTKSIMRRAECDDKTLVRSSIEDTIVEHIAECEQINDSKIIERAIESVYIASANPFRYSFK